MAGKGAGFMEYDSRRRRHRYYRPRPQLATNDCTTKPAVDVLTSFGSAALKSWFLQGAGYDRTTIEEILKPDVDDLKTKTVMALLVLLFCD
jgi:hypothetical protein